MMTVIRSFAAAALLGVTALLSAPAQAQYYGDPRPPVYAPNRDYERDARRERWRQRQEMERRDAYEQGRRDAGRGYGRRPVRCEYYRVQRPDEWGRMRTFRERRCS